MKEDEDPGFADRRPDGLQLQERAAELHDEGWRRFLAAAGHDLRQPLQTLGILVDILRRRIADPESRALLDRQETALLSMRGLLECFLDLSRIEAGAVTAAERSFPVREVLDNVRDEFVDQALRRGICLKIVSSSAVVRSDPLLLQRIVEVLVAHAMRYAGAARITVGCRRRGTRLRLEVWDTGDAVALEQVTAVLKQPQPRGAAASGYGLGLSVASRFADLLGHELDVRRAAGRGTKFALMLGRA